MEKNNIDDFWQRVRKTDSCWLWQAGKDQKGYGVFTYQGRTLGAHRFSAQIAGLNPQGLMVCHHCDEPSCVRPDHLFLGSARDNNQDKIRKGRHIYGQRHPLAKLSADQVREIRQRLEQYVPRSRPSLLGQLAREYSVDVSTIKGIRRGEKWRW
jgi:hypothetical protein